MKSATIRRMENNARQVVRNVAICFAVLMGLVALYYCLLPALAENANDTDVYVFFDNGLSQYEGKTVDGATTVVTGSVYSSANDSSVDAALDMRLLSDVIAENGTLWSAVKAQLGDEVTTADGKVTITNMNPANVYVSTTTVRVGNYISFSAWDSGTVYDTVVNYRINSASREWGYDYVDFQWTSPKTALTYGNNCYYAPPQLMIHRYAAEVAVYSGGPKALRQMIYQHGDSYNTTEYYDANGDGTIDTAAGDINIKYDASSKPEVTGTNAAWVNPQNAYGRTFYDAVLDMEGKFGAPTDVNDLAAASQSANGTTLEGSVALNGDGDNGLGDANTIYHATATFFDYFSDWELAGNPLTEHVTSYTYDSEDGIHKEEIWSLDQTITGGVATLTENFDKADDMLQFTNVGSGTVGVRDDVGSHTDDGSYVLQMFSRATAQYVLPTDATGDLFSASMWVRTGSANSDTVSVSLYYELNGTAHTLVLNKLTLGGWSQWTELTTGLFTVPDGATNAALRYSSVNTYRLDDFTLQYESSAATPDGVAEYTTIDSAPFDSGAPSDYGFTTVDVNGTADDNGDLSITGGSLYSYYHKPAVYTLSADKLKAGSYQYSIDALSTQWGLGAVSVFLSTDGGNSGTRLQTVTIGATSQDNVVHEIAGGFTVPEGATGVQLYFQTFNVWYTQWTDAATHGTDSAYYDNFKLKYYSESVSSSVKDAVVSLTHGENASGQSDYAEQMGVTLSSASDVSNNKGLKLFLNIADVQDSNNDGITGNGYPIMQGQYTYSNKESYLIEGVAFATGTVQLKATHYYQYFDGTVSTANRKMKYVGEEVLAEYSAGSIQISEHFAPSIGANATYLSLELVDSGTEVIISHIDISKALINLNGTFSEGTNRISYSYQGMTFNDAISQYYVSAGADASKVTPLYFGSNSWMTGNLRYYLADNRGQKVFTPAEVAKALAYVGAESVWTRDDYINTQYADGTPIYADGKVGQANYAYVGAYIFPLSREYWINLFGYGLTTAGDTSGVTTDGSTLTYNRNPNWEFDNEPMGGSNSRGVENLVVYNPELDIITLTNSGDTLAAPYFNTDFLQGENDANAVYGDVYENVDFAFAYNEDSKYYEFDSTKAYYAVRLTQDGTTGKYYMDYYNYSQLVDHYDGATTGKVVQYADDNANMYQGVSKADGDWGDTNGSSQTLYQFLPFNSPATNDRFATENLMFGMKLDIPFNMAKTLTYNGESVNPTSVSTSDSMFKFSGDDDVWVYVDGQKVLDIGGTHTAVGGFIDLKHGYGVLGSTYADYTGIWKNADDLSQGLTSGKDQAIQPLEKAAFAALAGLEELDIERTVVDALTVGNATGWVQYTQKATVDFFDDEYTFTAATNGGYFFQYRIRRMEDGEYVIDVNIPQAVNGGTISAGTVTFDLSVFTLEGKKTTSTTIIDGDQKIEYQIIDHELTIYYMERGLNSSNFKLAFNFVPNADRQVEKSWGDGADAHSDDAILVQLYGADPGSATGTFNLEDTDYSLVRMIGHTALANSDSDLFGSGFVKDDDKVSVRFQLDDENINSAAAVSINGMPITEEVYKQLHNSDMALTIYVDGTEVQIDGDGTYAGYEFFNPKNADGLTSDSDGYLADGFQIQYCTNDWGNSGNVSEAQKRSAIKVHDAATGSGSWIKIEFNQVDVTNDMPEPESGTNGWGFFNNSAWLIEVFGWNVDANTSIPVVSRGFNTTQESTVYMTDTVKNTSRTLNASDMQIVITNVMRERNNSTTAGNNAVSYVQACNVTATAVVPGDQLRLYYSYASSSTRKLMLGTGQWSNIFKFDKANYSIDSYYNGNTTVAFTSPVDILDVTTTGNSRAEMIVVGGGGSLNQALGLDFTYDNVFAVEDYGYSTEAPELYGAGNFDWNGDGQPDTGVYLLDDESDWLAVWDGLPSAETINNEQYKYKYFIRELAILEKNADGNYVKKTDTNYRTTYYADSIAEGNEITPVYFTIDGEAVPLYSLDTEEGKIVVSNEEITQATIHKAWSGVDESDKVEVTVNVYVEDPADPDVITLYDTVTIGPDNDWTVTLENLLVYNNNQTNPQKLNYYAAEQELEQFTATYNGTRVTKNYGGSELVVYQLNTVTTADPVTGEEKETYALTVTNQSSGFVLEIDKFDEDGTTPLEGATFVLYEWTGEGNPNDYTDADGEKSWDKDGDGVWSAEEIMANVGFGLWMPVSDGETTETQTVDETETASVDTPRSVKVMNKVVQTATATIAQVNGSTTYTTTKKVGSIEAAASTLTSERELIINGAGNDYFAISKGTNDVGYGGTISYNGKSTTNGVKMESATRIEFTTGLKGTLTLYVVAHSNYLNTDTSIVVSGADSYSVSKAITTTDSTTVTALVYDLNQTGAFSVAKDGGQCYIGYIKFTPYPVPETLIDDQSLNFYQGNNTSPYFVYYQNDGKSLGYSDEASYDVNGTTVKSRGLKMQGGTRVGFSIGTAGTLTVYAMPNSQAAQKSYTINIVDSDGNVVKSQTVDCSNLTTENYFGVVTKLEFVFKADELGEYTITRGDEQAFINYISFEVLPLPLDNATDAELMMELMNNNVLKYTHEDKDGETIDPETWYSSDLAKQIADAIVGYQVKVDYAGKGGWTKEFGGGTHYAAGYKDWGQATIDNDITTAQIRFLAKVYQATGVEDYFDSVVAGINFILGPAYVGEYYHSDGTNENNEAIRDAGLRYANGGFAQRFDESESAYHHQITYNDDAMVNVLRVLTEIGTGKGDFSFLYDTDLADEAIDAVHAGVQCILDTQIIVNSNQTIFTYYDNVNNKNCGGTKSEEWEGKYTGWCQQYDPKTLEPGWARAFEPPSISSRESVGIILYLIDYYNSDICTDELKAVLPRRINAAVDWISSESIRIDEVVVEHSTSDGGCTGIHNDPYPSSTFCDGERENCRWAVYDGEKSSWARFYSITDGKTPIWADRVDEIDEAGNGIRDDYENNIRYSYNAMSCERRSGYNYIDTWGKDIAANPDAYRIPVDGTTVMNLVVYPSTPENAGYVSAINWNDHGDDWFIINGIKNQDLVYGDVNFVFSDLPTALIGAEYIRPANASSAQNAANALATFRLSKAANLYIPIAEGATLPDEMSGWEKTTVTIVVNGQTMTLYSISLAANADSASAPYFLYSLADANALNYGVFVVVGSAEPTKYITDANGEVSIAGLKADTYYAIIEITAPIGYLPLEKPALFSVFTVTEGEQMGTIDTTKAPEVIDKTGFVSMEWNSNNTASLDADILNDSTHVELPNTGGSLLSILLRGIAALLPILAGVHFVWKRTVRPVE